MPRIILASASPRRKQLLEWADIPFDIMVAETREDYPEGLSEEEISIHIAVNKALAVRERISSPANAIILAADTIVTVNNEIIGKPADRSQAIASLTLLSGRKHQVISGVCLLYEQREIRFCETTDVEFHPLSLSQIEYYVDHYHPYDKAGAYAIQEWIGVTAVKAIRGDFYNVMGLPVSKVIREIEALHPSGNVGRF